MGWDEFDKIKENSNENENRFNYLITSVFSNEEGKELLKFLKDRFLCASVAPPNQTSNYAYFREGQNSLVRHIISIIDTKDGDVSNYKQKG